MFLFFDFKQLQNTMSGAGGADILDRFVRQPPPGIKPVTGPSSHEHAKGHAASTEHASPTEQSYHNSVWNSLFPSSPSALPRQISRDRRPSLVDGGLKQPPQRRPSVLGDSSLHSSAQRSQPPSIQRHGSPLSAVQRQSNLPSSIQRTTSQPAQHQSHMPQPRPSGERPAQPRPSGERPARTARAL